MNTLTKSTAAGNAVVSPKADAYIGIDYHKRYSVYHVVDHEGRDLAKGRIEHHSPQDFVTLVQRWPKCRVVFETSMNWHWLYEALERGMDGERIVLANSYKTRIIAECHSGHIPTNNICAANRTHKPTNGIGCANPFEK